jgi:hypothetical protein
VVSNLPELDEAAGADGDEAPLAAQAAQAIALATSTPRIPTRMAGV